MNLKKLNTWKKYTFGMLSATILLIVVILSIAIDHSDYGEVFSLLIRLGMISTLVGISFDIQRRRKVKKLWVFPVLFFSYFVGKLFLYFSFPQSDLYNVFQSTCFLLFWFLLLLELGKEKDNGLSTGLYYFLKSFLPSLGFFIIVVLVEFGVLSLIEDFTRIDYKLYAYISSITFYIFFQYFLIQLEREKESRFLNGFHQWVLMPATVLMIFILLIGSIITILEQNTIHDTILFNYYFFIFTGWTSYFLSDYRLKKEGEKKLTYHDYFYKAFPVVNGVLSIFLLLILFLTPKDMFYTPAKLYFLCTIVFNLILGIFSFTKNFHKKWVLTFIFFIIFLLSPISPYPMAIHHAKTAIEDILKDHPEYLEEGEIKKEIIKETENYKLNKHLKNYIFWTNKDHYGFTPEDAFDIPEYSEDNSDYIHYGFHSTPVKVKDTEMIYFPYADKTESSEYYIQTQKHSFSVMKDKEVLDNFSVERIHQFSNQDHVLITGEHGNYFVLTVYEEYLDYNTDKKALNIEGIFITK